ncbi:LamG domain-containing protein, partial [Akkermansiaceae bacterium]|nr:LamG domain-containing protein [Akkermansiaceae bacterium]
ASLSLLTQLSYGQGDTLKDDLVSYWPLDEVQGNKTPDLASGFDLVLQNMDASNLVSGQAGMGFSFDSSLREHLVRTHDPADDLPAIKNDSFTIAFWTKTTGTGQSDLRLFSEGSSTNGNPLFTMGTVPGGGTSLDVFIRENGSFNVNHVPTVAAPLDGAEWHHVAFVQELQPDGTATRQVYVDGVLDAIVIPNKEANFQYTQNITSFGGVVRDSDVAHVTGELDEIAIWKRALIPDEITDLIANGMPSLDDQVEELAIGEFFPEFGTVVSGDQVKLIWDATKDATLSISPDVGDVTAVSDFGVGSTLVTVNEETTYTLTASRDGEPAVTATLTVTPISGVATGWNWIEDFDTYPAGALVTQGNWNAPTGSWSVSTVGDTQALMTTGGNDLAGRFLKTHGIAEDSSGTLFFRFCLSDLEPDLPFTIKAGLTEKGFRFVNDWAANIGTYVTLVRDASGPLRMEAISGIGGVAVDSGFTFDQNLSYDVWIDVTNRPLDETDTFSVHVAQTGGSRTTVFDDFDSDRSPDGVFLLGFPRAPIDSVFLVTTLATDEASQAMAFDDFYMSPAGSFLSTVPVASGLGKAAAGPPVITSLSYDKVTGEVTVVWSSSPNTNYAIHYSETLEEGSWVESDDSIPSTDTVTTKTLDETFSQSKLFFRVSVPNE